MEKVHGGKQSFRGQTSTNIVCTCLLNLLAKLSQPLEDCTELPIVTCAGLYAQRPFLGAQNQVCGRGGEGPGSSAALGAFCFPSPIPCLSPHPFPEPESATKPHQFSDQMLTLRTSWIKSCIAAGPRPPRPSSNEGERGKALHHKSAHLPELFEPRARSCLS